MREDSGSSDLPERLGHELRQPLAAIDAFAALLEEGHAGPLSAEQLEHVATIRNNVRAIC